MPWVNNCCGCGSLKFGTIFTGVLGMLVGVGMLLVVLLTTVKMRTIIIDTLPPEIVKIIVALNLVMTIFISLLLVIGAIKRNKWMMMPWVVLAILIAIGMVVSVVYTAVVLFMNSHVWTGVIWLIFGLIGAAIFVYLWVVVYSFYQLVEEEKGQGPYNFPYGRR